MQRPNTVKRTPAVKGIFIMQKTLASIATAAVLTFSVAAPSHAVMSLPDASKSTTATQEQIIHKTGGKKYGKFAAGVIVGLGVSGALGHGYYGYYDGYNWRHESRCRRWKRHCNKSFSKSACWKYDQHCW
jgi:hypothetical protein